MDTIYEFTWKDTNGSHSTTVVGSAELRDQWDYLAILQATNMVWDVDYTVVGQDI